MGYLDMRKVGTELLVRFPASGEMRRGCGCSPDGDCQVTAVCFRAWVLVQRKTHKKSSRRGARMRQGE